MEYFAVVFSDDTAFIEISDFDVKYFAAVCKENFLDLNLPRTKEMIIDF